MTDDTMTDKESLDLWFRNRAARPMGKICPDPIVELLCEAQMRGGLGRVGIQEVARCIRAVVEHEAARESTAQGGQPATSREQGDDARDAARYRWLREQSGSLKVDRPEDQPGSDYLFTIFGEFYGATPACLDVGIDAELRKGADHGITPATEGAKP